MPLLTLTCVLIPFQKYAQDILAFPGHIQFMDEVFIAVILIIGMISYSDMSKLWKPVFYIFLVLLFFCFVGILSGLYNQIPARQTILGIFDYVKNFLPIVLLPAISFRQTDLNVLYVRLLKLAVFFVLIGIIQEILWTLNMDCFYLGEPVENRFGFWRVPSLLGHPNFLGLYSLLFLTLNFSLHPKFNRYNLILLIGVLLSGSKFVWGSTLFVFLVYTLNRFQFSFRINVKRSILLLSCFSLALFISPYIYQKSTLDFSTDYFRGYVFAKSVEIWHDYPLLGSGPGTYGGVVSFIYNSPIYSQYHFSSRWFEFMQSFRSLDQFWAQCLVETGIVGLTTFVLLLTTFFFLLRKCSRQTEDSHLKQFFEGLSLLVIVLTFYLFGSGLNMTPFLLTYSILCGMCLSAARPAFMKVQRDLNEYLNHQ